jgi:hypothetical protein
LLPAHGHGRPLPRPAGAQEVGRGAAVIGNPAIRRRGSNLILTEA